MCAADPAAGRLAQARTLTDVLPVTLATLDAGDLTLRHTRGLCAMAGRVDPLIAAQVEAAVVPDAAESTPRAIDRAVARAVLLADPAGAAVRHRRAAGDRYVSVTAEADGMAWLTAYGPAADVHTVHTRLDAATRLLPSEDPRTLGQQRFDLLVDGLLTGIGADGLPTTQGRSPHIHVTVAATTLLGLDNHPGELAGYGPIDADTARAVAREDRSDEGARTGARRQIAADQTGTWRRIVTDPVSGQILDYGRTTYRPPHHLTDHLIARDRTCRFPGCSIPAARCDLDHTLPWDQGGATSAGNLAALCRRHHELKTKKLWSYRLLDDGTTEWTSPAARRTYRARSESPTPPEPQSPRADTGDPPF